MYLHLLILCGIAYQGIVGTLADEGIKSSDFLVRQKRVVSYVPGEDVVFTVGNAGYVVAVKYEMRIKCTGNILTHHVIISAASCTEGLAEHYQIGSSSARSDRGQNRNVTDIKRHLAISLLTVNTPFLYSHYCYNIELHEGPLLPGLSARVSGWGFNFRTGGDRGTIHPTSLRSIVVPIMAHRDCVNRYRPHLQITDKEICIYDCQKHCGHNDFGAGLVIDDKLAGIHVRTGLTRTQIDPRYPSVFVILQDSDYRLWIRSNLQSIEQRLQSGHNLFSNP